jgi:hypothetical protein
MSSFYGLRFVVECLNIFERVVLEHPGTVFTTLLFLRFLIIGPISKSVRYWQAFPA